MLLPHGFLVEVSDIESIVVEEIDALRSPPRNFVNDLNVGGLRVYL
jgi:hypothetical protein